MYACCVRQASLHTNCCVRTHKTNHSLACKQIVCSNYITQVRSTYCRRACLFFSCSRACLLFWRHMEVWDRATCACRKTKSILIMWLTQCSSCFALPFNRFLNCLRSFAAALPNSFSCFLHNTPLFLTWCVHSTVQHSSTQWHGCRWDCPMLFRADIHSHNQTFTIAAACSLLPASSPSRRRQAQFNKDSVLFSVHRLFLRHLCECCTVYTLLLRKLYKSTDSF